MLIVVGGGLEAVIAIFDESWYLALFVVSDGCC